MHAHRRLTTVDDRDLERANGGIAPAIAIPLIIGGFFLNNVVLAPPAIGAPGGVKPERPAITAPASPQR